jgi:hypothetical protein
MSKYGRIIFYDTRDGMVFYDTGETEGNIAPDPETYYKILEQKYGNRDNMAHMQLDLGQFKEQFDKGMYCTILLLSNEVFFSKRDTKYHLGSKNTLNDRDWPLFENLYALIDKDNNIDVEKVQKFYDDYLNFNLRAICTICPVVWYDLHYMEEHRKKIDRSRIKLFDNGVFPPMEEFAEEIYKDIKFLK